MILLSFLNVFYGLYCMVYQLVPASVAEAAALLACRASICCSVLMEDLYYSCGYVAPARVTRAYYVEADAPVRALLSHQLAAELRRADARRDARVVVFYSFPEMGKEYALMVDPWKPGHARLPVPYTLAEVRQHRQEHHDSYFPYAAVEIGGKDVTGVVLKYAGPKFNWHADVPCAAFDLNYAVTEQGAQLAALGDVANVIALDTFDLERIPLSFLGCTDLEAPDESTDSEFEDAEASHSD